MESKVSYIYRVTNTINGKIYIGQSVDPIRRLRTHKNSYNKKNYLLSHAIRKYGIENFLFEVIRSEVPIEQINEYEIQCIKEYNCKVPNGYNLTDGGGGRSGYTCSEKTIQKMKDAQYGKRHSLESRKKMSESSKNPSEETRQKIRNAAKNISEETRKKMSDAAKERMTTEFRQYLSNNKKGSKLSEETKKKISEAGIGRTQSEETKKKKSDALKGRVFSEESKRKMREAAKNRKPITEETREKFRRRSSGKSNPMYGKKQSEETKCKIRKALKNRSK